VKPVWHRTAVIYFQRFDFNVSAWRPSAEPFLDCLAPHQRAFSFPESIHGYQFPLTFSFAFALSLTHSVAILILCFRLNPSATRSGKSGIG
jgi:hypothetical protein